MKPEPHATSAASVTPAALPAGNAQASMRTEARALLALGWLPSPHEPGLVYALHADVPSVIAELAWSVMRQVLIERGK